MAEYIMKSSPILESDGTPLEVVGELIRCNDCKYYGFNDWLHCPMTDSKADDYCSRAERKEE